MQYNNNCPVQMAGYGPWHNSWQQAITVWQHPKYSWWNLKRPRNHKESLRNPDYAYLDSNYDTLYQSGVEQLQSHSLFQKSQE